MLNKAAATYFTALLLSFTCYLNSLSGELVHDDIFAVRDNRDLRSSTPIAQLLRDDFWGEAISSPTSHKSYRPLTVLTFRLNYVLHELQPWGYHVINVLLHGLATVLFGLVCRKMVCVDPSVSASAGGSGWSSGGGGWSSREGLVFTAMMLFASHPVHTEAVSKEFTTSSVLIKFYTLIGLVPSFHLHFSRT